MKYNYDYSQTLWMKLFMAKPDFPNHKSEVYFTFEQALDVIKTVDCLTQGIKKIVYLVGWQGLGHDDCYPEMEKVNEYLADPGDKSARDALWNLFEEAKKYIDQDVSKLYDAIGEPSDSSYAPSCMGPGQDGELYYEGFTVATYKDGDKETVRDVNINAN